MTETEGRKLSEKAEDAIRGLLLFVLRYARTTVTVAVTPWRMASFIGPATERFVSPFTFLTIAYFLYSIVISVTAGSWILDVIWQTEDVARQLIDRLQAGLSLTSLTVTALPGTVMVFGAGYALSCLTFDEEGDRALLTRLACYTFGAQCIMLFAVVALVLSTELDTGRILALPAWLAGLRAWGVAVPFAVAGLALWALIAPAVCLIFSVRGVLRLRDARIRASHVFFVAIFAVVVPVAYTYAGQAVARTISKLYPDKPIGSVIIGDVGVLHSPRSTVLTFNLAISNPSKVDFVFDGTGMQIDLIVDERRAETRRRWSAVTVVTDPDTGGEQSVVVVPSHMVRPVRIRAVFDRVPDAVVGHHGAGGPGAYCLQVAAYAFDGRLDSTCQYRTFAGRVSGSR